MDLGVSLLDSIYRGHCISFIPNVNLKSITLRVIVMPMFNIVKTTYYISHINMMFTLPIWTAFMELSRLMKWFIKTYSPWKVFLCFSLPANLIVDFFNVIIFAFLVVDRFVNPYIGFYFFSCTPFTSMKHILMFFFFLVNNKKCVLDLHTMPASIIYTN